MIWYHIPTHIWAGCNFGRTVLSVDRVLQSMEENSSTFLQRSGEGPSWFLECRSRIYRVLKGSEIPRGFWLSQLNENQHRTNTLLDGWNLKTLGLAYQQCFLVKPSYALHLLVVHDKRKQCKISLIVLPRMVVWFQSIYYQIVIKSDWWIIRNTWDKTQFWVIDRTTACPNDSQGDKQLN